MYQCYNDEMICRNLLIALKDLKVLYNTFLQEASNDALYEQIFTCYQTISNDQRTLYNLMVSENFMQVTSEKHSKIKTAYETFKNTQSNLID